MYIDVSMDVVRRTDWMRAATLAHKLLCQALSDEELDALVSPAPDQADEGPRAA